MICSVSAGLTCSTPPLTSCTRRLLTYISNSLLPPPVWLSSQLHLRSSRPLRRAGRVSGNGCGESGWEMQPAAAAARGSRSGWERQSRAIGQNCAPVKLVDHIRLLGLRSRGRQPEEVQEDVQEVQEERATRHRRHRHSSAGRWIAFVCKCEWRTMSRRPSALRVLLAVSAQQHKGGSEQESEQESEHQPEHVLEPRARDRAQLSSAPEPEPDSVVVCFRPTLLAQQQAGAGAPHRSRNRVLLVRVRPTLLAQQH